MEVEKFDNVEIYQFAAEMTRIMNAAVKNALDENRRLGVPSVFGINGTIVYQMPDGSIVTESPFTK